MIAFTFAALTVDVGMIALTETSMQNAADAAALAAAQEITVAVETAGANAQEGGEAPDINSIAVEAAKAKAVSVAQLNGFYVNPDTDIAFGKQVLDGETGIKTIAWGTAPYNGSESYNVVKVTIRKDNPNMEAEDSKLKIFFSPFVSPEAVALKVDATSFVEARDIVLVLDYSGSMNDDSRFDKIDSFGLASIEANLQQIWQDMGSPVYGTMGFNPAFVTLQNTKTTSSDPTISCLWRGTQVVVTSSKKIFESTIRGNDNSTQKFTPDYNAKTPVTYARTGTSNSDKLFIKSIVVNSGDSSSTAKNFTIEFNNTNIKTALGLTNSNYPYAGGSWDDYYNYCIAYKNGMSRYDDNLFDSGHRYKFGVMTYINYMLKNYPRYSQCKDFYKTRHYPFHSMKEGTTLFLDFLDNLDFGDHVGLVTYDSTSRIEKSLVDTYMGVNVTLGDDWISDDYETVDIIQKNKQAGHYDIFTGIGYGIDSAIDLLDEKGRFGARPTILLMTDGQANRYPDGWSLPSSWNWSDVTDSDGDGDADYTTSDKSKQYSLYQAKLAIDKGYKIHTLSVGSGADTNFMAAIANMGGGESIVVPGGTSIEQMNTELRAAFARIAANVPPPQLLHDADSAD
jgi:hypothetical protein